MCYFLHDECVRVLKEYEVAKAPVVTLKFKSRAEADAFQKLAQQDSITALQGIGRHRHARKVILNQITMAMTSDCLHHIFEALRCFEKRKVIVGFNLLRKPLKDSLVYLSWMLADEEDFYANFSEGDPTRLSPKIIGNRRKEIFKSAIVKADLGNVIEANTLNEVLFDKTSSESFEPLFQHAVHLITIQNAELRTSPLNFNFIFKNMNDEDVYPGIYRWLPYILLYLSHVIMALFERIRPMDKGSRCAFQSRSLYGFALACDLNTEQCLGDLREIMGKLLKCGHCGHPLKVTRRNGARLMMTESFRCTSCQRINPFPFAWAF